MADIITMTPIPAWWPGATSPATAWQPLQSVVDISAYDEINITIYMYRASAAVSLDFYTDLQNSVDDGKWGLAALLAKGTGAIGEGVTQLQIVTTGTTSQLRYLRWLLTTTPGSSVAFSIFLSGRRKGS